MKAVQIKGKILEVPIIQGGMGIGVSRCGLAGAVAREGGMGVISAAQIGYDAPEFQKHPEAANRKAIKEHIEKAKKTARGRGLIGINIMVATQHYEDYVKEACEAGVDAIISGAGLPVDLPKFASGYETALAPIVSSEKSANVILKYWDRKYQRTADFLVIEGPKAGGHLGFSREELAHMSELNYDQEIQKILSVKKKYEDKYHTYIPVFVAGGIFDPADVVHALELGADGVQVATRFVATKECDASEALKQAYVRAREEDVVITDSPVGMPGRAIRNAFIDKIQTNPPKVTHCFRCLKACDPASTKYCITKALMNAVNGNLDQGLIFCGARVGEIKEITTVEKVIKELNI